VKDHTIEEITTKVEGLFNGERYPPHDLEVNVSKLDGEVRINVSAMYEAPGLDFAKLSALAEFFETKNINDDDRFGSGGCETCDYGSSYGFELVIRPDKEAK
jgi:hypothetical protein